jgi:hypothetical protein
MVQNQNVVALDTSFIKNTECLMNECITIFQIPNQLTEEEQALIDEVATVFFQDELPFEFQQKAKEQQEIIGERDLLAEQQATNQTSEHLNEPIKSEDESGITRVGGVSLGVGNPSETALMLVEKQTEPNVFTRGDIVKVVGKIILDKPSPYFMNINITCCEMSSFRAMSAVETDPQGNFVIKFATSMVYPLGDWKVVISTIGDDNKILNNVYDFKLIDEFGNER